MDNGQSITTQLIDKINNLSPKLQKVMLENWEDIISNYGLNESTDKDNAHLAIKLWCQLNGYTYEISDNLIKINGIKFKGYSTCNFEFKIEYLPTIIKKIYVTLDDLDTIYYIDDPDTIMNRFVNGSINISPNKIILNLKCNYEIHQIILQGNDEKITYEYNWLII